MKFALVCVSTYEDVEYYYNKFNGIFQITKRNKTNKYSTDEEEINYIGYDIKIDSIEELWKFKQIVFSGGYNRDILIEDSYYMRSGYCIKEPTIRIVDGCL